MSLRSIGMFPESSTWVTSRSGTSAALSVDGVTTGTVAESGGSGLSVVLVVGAGGGAYNGASYLNSGSGNSNSSSQYGFKSLLFRGSFTSIVLSALFAL